MLKHLDKKSQKGTKALETAQKQVIIPYKRLITPVNNKFAYLIHSFYSLLENKGVIKYLYSFMNNIPDIIRKQKPSLKSWSVTSTFLMTMRRIVSSIVKNQSTGGKWLISEIIIHTVRVYIYFSSDEVHEVFMVELYHMVEEKDGLVEARKLRSNLEEMHMKIWFNVKSKLSRYLDSYTLSHSLWCHQQTSTTSGLP